MMCTRYTCVYSTHSTVNKCMSCTPPSHWYFIPLRTDSTTYMYCIPCPNRILLISRPMLSQFVLLSHCQSFPTLHFVHPNSNPLPHHPER